MAFPKATSYFSFHCLISLTRNSRLCEMLMVRKDIFFLFLMLVGPSFLPCTWFLLLVFYRHSLSCLGYIFLFPLFLDC